MNECEYWKREEEWDEENKAIEQKHKNAILRKFICVEYKKKKNVRCDWS